MRIVRILGILTLLSAAVVGVGAAASGRHAAPAAAPSAASLQAAYVSVVQKVGPSVVQIEAGNSLGSGVVFDRKGDIVTNAHVVGSARQVTVTLASGKQYAGRVVAAFPAGDLAVVRIEATGLRPLPLANSSKLRVGTLVLAIGNPLGLRSSVTDGIVSAVGRTVAEPSGTAIPNAIQTSAAINPGNSGGALVDLQGRLVGIPTLAASDPQLGGQAPGIGFAIPSDTVRDIATQIVQHGKVVNSRRAYLGVTVGDTVGGNGVYIGSVAAGGPAAKAGVQPGDVLVAVAGKPTPTTAALSEALAGMKPGQRVALTVVRADGKRATLTLTLGSFPGS